MHQVPQQEATAGDGNSRTLNIKGSMKGHSTGSNNHIRKRKPAPDTVATERASGTDAEWEEKGEKKEINEWESGKPSTCHSE